MLLQTLNILENFDVAGMGYNSTRYIHMLYQAMNLAYADRDFLNIVEFGMNVQEAAEADNFLSYQLHDSFGDHKKEPGRLAVNESVTEFTRGQLSKMGYAVEVGVWGRRDRTSGPINAIWFDRKNGTLQGGSSNHGDDYGIAW